MAEISMPDTNSSLNVNKEARSGENTQPVENTQQNARESSLSGTQFDELMAEGKSYVDKDNEKALQKFQNALLVANSDMNRMIQAKLWIAKMQLEIKNYMEAENAFREILKNKLNSSDEEASLEGLIRTKIATGNANIAIEIIPLNYNFKTPGLVLALVDAYIKLGKEPQASYLLEKEKKLLSNLEEPSLKKKLDLANEKISENNKEENKKNYNEYIKGAHYAEYINDFKSALQYYERAFKLFKDDLASTVEARLGMAKMYYALGKLSDAKKLYAELLKENLKKSEHAIVEEALKLAKNSTADKVEKLDKVDKVSKKAESLERKPVAENMYIKCIDPCLLKLVEEKVAQKNYKKAIIMLDRAIRKEPCNIYLYLKKIDLYQETEQYKNALFTLNTTDRRFACNSKTFEARKNVEEKLCQLPHNRVGIYYDWQYVSDVQQYWRFTTYSYYRSENYFQYGIAYNTASRLGLKGDQAQVDFSINPLRGIRGDFTFAYASRNQFLWPNRVYYGELYYTFLNGSEFSFGQENRRYLTFDNQKIIRTTATVGQYFDKYFLYCRVNRYNFFHTVLGRIGLTRFFGDNDYISFDIIAGSGPDIADLPPLDNMVLLKQKGYSLSGQVELFPNFLVKVGIGFYAQFYPFNNLHRNITDNYVNVVWKF